MKRSPIVNPEEPEESEGHTWTGHPYLDASKITANSLTGHYITGHGQQRARDAVEYMKKRYGTKNPSPGTRGLFQFIKPSYEKDDNS